MPAIVSVIIPCHNAAPYLRDAILSALRQTWYFVDVIVVDDGSTDNSVRIAREFNDPRIRVLEQPNAGAGVARNTGIAHARGDFLQFLDADDLLHPEKIERQVRALYDQKKHATHVATAAWGRFDADHMAVMTPNGPLQADLDPVTWLCASHGGGGGMMATAAWLVPLPIAKKAGPWMTRRSPNDDGEYFARCLLASEGTVHVPEAVAYYRRVPNGWAGVRSPDAVQGLYESHRSIAEHLLAREDSPRTRQAMAHLFQSLAHELYPDHPAIVSQAERHVHRLGGSATRADGGPMFRAVSHVIGWKAARRVQRALVKTSS